MSKKQIRILIITFIVVVLLVFIVFLLTNSDGKLNNVINNKESNIENVDNNTKLDSEIIEEPIIEKKKEDVTELEIKAIAKNFAERYGTWSTDNKDDNFKSAEIYASSRMKGIIKDFILDNEKLSEDYTDFYGLTTKALNVKILDSNNISASLNVSVQQIESSGKSLDKKTSYKSLSLELIKYNNDWLVDYAEWE